MMGWGKIAVGVRCGSRPDAYFFRCWHNFISQGLRRKDVAITPVIELPHHYAANQLMNNMLASKCDSFCFVDDDMVFGVDLLERLRSDTRAHEFDICQALYIQRKPPHYPLVMEKDSSSPTGIKINPKPKPNSVVEVGVVGLGFTLIRRVAVEEMLRRKPKDQTLFYWGMGGSSEDACFSRDAMAAGYRLCVNTGVTAGHRMAVVMDWDSDNQELKLLTRTIVEENSRGSD